MIEKNVDKSIELYEMIRQSMSGLAEVLKINLDDLWCQIGMENLDALNDSIIELLKHVHSPREIRIKLRELEFDAKEADQAFPY